MEINVSQERVLPNQIDELVMLALTEGFRNVLRLQNEFVSGANRFNKPGEALFVARSGGQLAGIVGLNVDPYASSGEVGRIRRLFVHPGFRRKGVASRLVDAIETAAGGQFHKLRLYTDAKGARVFYEKRGYSVVSGQQKVSHQKMLCL
ncbi:MAG: GNAT family N-acetyltransferase [Bacteroidota bacterium]